MVASKRSYSLLVQGCLLSLVLILSACQKYGQQEARLAGGDGKLDPSGKLEESYTPEQQKQITDISKLESYKTKLSPLFEKLNGTSWTTVVQLKKWLMVPGTLNPEDSRNMSVHFLDGEESALAIQTSEDIRVQKGLFESLSADEQAEFLLTEIMTSAYLLRNLNETELCKLVKAHSAALTCPFLKTTTTNEADDLKLGTLQDKSKAKKKEKPKGTVVHDPRYGKKEPMRVVDYNRVTLLVRFIKDGTGVTHKSVIAKMTELGFDTRIFQTK